MRIFKTILFWIAWVISALFLMAYSREVWQLYQVRPWGGLDNFIECRVLVCTAENFTGFRVSPFFWGDPDPSWSATIVGAFPTWLLLLPALGIVLVGLFAFFGGRRERGALPSGQESESERRRTAPAVRNCP